MEVQILLGAHQAQSFRDHRIIRPVSSAVEQEALNFKVAGSNPARVTKVKIMSIFLLRLLLSTLGSLYIDKWWNQKEKDKKTHFSFPLKI